MTNETRQIEVSGIPIEIVRKDIKHLHLGVYPPDGRVRVATPLRLDDEAVRLAVIGKLGWIHRKQRQFSEQQRQSPREMVSGESHYYQGQRFRLDVVEKEATPEVSIPNNSTLRLQVRPGTNAAKRLVILEEWYRTRLKEQLPDLLDKWQQRIDIDVSEARVRKMRTHWGTCNIEARRIWLNLELIKKPVVCLEYILVHEMVHLLERYHNDQFRQLMDHFLPDWRIRRDELNRSPLAHEGWQY